MQRRVAVKPESTVAYAVAVAAFETHIDGEPTQQASTNTAPSRWTELIDCNSRSNSTGHSIVSSSGDQHTI
jgi:hypothetical protein